MAETERTLRLVWDADAVQRAIAAWRRRNYEQMQERDERKRAERRARAVAAHVEGLTSGKPTDNVVALRG